VAQKITEAAEAAAGASRRGAEPGPQLRTQAEPVEETPEAPTGAEEAPGPPPPGPSRSGPQAAGAASDEDDGETGG
jgi:hypothetical protein